jgi:hypothetical protein
MCGRKSRQDLQFINRLGRRTMLACFVVVIEDDGLRLINRPTEEQRTLLALFFLF